MTNVADTHKPALDLFPPSEPPSLLKESIVEVQTADGTKIGWTVAHDALDAWLRACRKVGLSGLQADPARLLAAEFSDLRDFYDTLLADAKLLDAALTVNDPTPDWLKIGGDAPRAVGRWWMTACALRRTAKPSGEDRRDLVLTERERYDGTCDDASAVSDR